MKSRFTKGCLFLAATTLSLFLFLLHKTKPFPKQQEPDFSRFYVGEWIVYSDKGNRGVLTVQNAHTKEKRVLTNGDTRILAVSQGQVYYYDYFHASTMRIDPANQYVGAESFVDEHPDSLAVVENFAYYINDKDHSIYVIELGKQEAKLVSTGYSTRLRTDGESLYFINVHLGYALQRIQINHTEAETIHPGPVSEYELSQDKIILTLPRSGDHLFRMATDGGELVELYGEAVYDLRIFNSEIYFRIGPAGKMFKMDLEGNDLTEV